MNVLSLFDGISCGQIALERAGIKVSQYFASEIDKNSIKVTMTNYPNTTQVGDVTKVKATDLPKIDILIGGSPCQGFSFSGKQLNFEDPRSKLFFEFVRLLEECKPKYFLLENVKMKREYEQVITNLLKVQPIKINSGLVSAQNRERIYWTNIPNVTQPQDKNVSLMDIAEKCPSGFVPDNNTLYDDQFTKVNVYESIYSANVNSNADITSLGDLVFVRQEKLKTSKVGLIYVGGFVKKNVGMWQKDNGFGQGSFSQGYRVYLDRGKSATLNANSGGLGGKTGLYEIDGIVRRLTPIECERLQTVPDGYTSCVSKTSRVRMLGDGWTVDVIAHIFKNIPQTNTK